MHKEKVIEIISELRKNTRKRNFVQSFDFIITLKGLDLKKPDQKVDFFITLPYPIGKKTKIGAFVGPELVEDARKIFDTVITPEDFPQYSEKKQMKKLASEHAHFIAQANIMNQVATQFGKILGSRGKMPNPKAGSVVPPKGANLKEIYEKLQNTVKLATKNSLMLQCIVGNEDSPDEEIAGNVVGVYNQVLNSLPGQQNNIKRTLLKLTMSKPVEISK
ncbi:MAG: hypothetical protein ACOCQG_04370 [Candidatus Nanoarchaeia archaeon]